MSPPKISLSIVVPVYRSEIILPLLIEKLQKKLNELQLLDDFELILVNDSSPDHSWKVICDLAAKYPFVRGLSLRRNFGQHNATMAGLHQARGKIIVVMDDDLQHPPDAIDLMIAAIESGYDVCYTKYTNRQHAVWKKLGSAFNDWVARYLLDKPRGLYLSSFKAMSAEVVAEIIKYDGPYAYIDGLILDVTRNIDVVSINHRARHSGEGNYNLRRSVSLWLKMATSFSILPLRLASYAGFLISVFSLIMIAYVVIQKFLHPEIPAGWASLIATILLIGGIQTLSIGMLGEYLGRTYLKLNHKPQFVIASRTWNAHEQG